MSKAKASEYRGVAARMNYLAAERPDLQYDTKEACCEMSTPTSGSWSRLVRIGRYLPGRPRMIWKFDLQEATNQFDTYADANWSGCLRTQNKTPQSASSWLAIT